MTSDEGLTETREGQGISGAGSGDLVILVHGIRTHARWQGAVRSELERAGFDVELTNYGRFDLFKFLVPIWAFRLTVIDRLREQISDAIKRHSGRRVSFIAHSFGTFALGHILRAAMGLKVHRIILCGSVLPYKFPLAKVAARAEILNEIGGRDHLPAIAESVTWGYGSTGSYGFRVPGVRDRHHNKFPHSRFLTADFCRDFWVPFLRDGTVKDGDDLRAAPNMLISAGLFLLNKYFVIGALAVGILWNQNFRSQPITIDVSAPRGYAFVGTHLGDLVQSIRADSCTPSSWLELVRQRRCIQLTHVDNRLGDLVLCTARNERIRVTSRDPAVLLQRLSDRSSCLQLSGVQGRQWSISLDDQRLVELQDGDRTYRFCGCTEDAVQAFKEKN